MEKIQKETIKDAIAHLVGYKIILEKKLLIPALAVTETIKELRSLLK